jgi:hypothetical protein
MPVVLDDSGIVGMGFRTTKWQDNFATAVNVRGLGIVVVTTYPTEEAKSKLSLNGNCALDINFKTIAKLGCRKLLTEPGWGGALERLASYVYQSERSKATTPAPDQDTDIIARGCAIEGGIAEYVMNAHAQGIRIDRAIDHYRAQVGDNASEQSALNAIENYVYTHPDVPPGAANIQIYKICMAQSGQDPNYPTPLLSPN